MANTIEVSNVRFYMYKRMENVCISVLFGLCKVLTNFYVIQILKWDI